MFAIVDDQFNSQGIQNGTKALLFFDIQQKHLLLDYLHTQNKVWRICCELFLHSIYHLVFWVQLEVKTKYIF